MATLTETKEQLRDTDGFLVESPEGSIGRVEEIWVGESNEPLALAVETPDGRHGLLLAEEVVAVQREQRWVVVPSEPKLLELDRPHMTNGAQPAEGKPITASWTTTGMTIAPTRPSPPDHHRLPHLLAKEEPLEAVKRPVWQVIGVLYLSLAFAIAFLIGLSFALAWLISGNAY